MRPWAFITVVSTIAVTIGVLATVATLLAVVLMRQPEAAPAIAPQATPATPAPTATPPIRIPTPLPRPTAPPTPAEALGRRLDVQFRSEAEACDLVWTISGTAMEMHDFDTDAAGPIIREFFSSRGVTDDEMRRVIQRCMELHALGRWVLPP